MDIGIIHIHHHIIIIIKVHCSQFCQILYDQTYCICALKLNVNIKYKYFSCIVAFLLELCVSKNVQTIKF